MGVGHAAVAGMAQSQQGPFDTFNHMLASKMAYDNLPDDEKEAFFRARASFKHTPTETFKDCPGDITVLARAFQAALRVATAITLGATMDLMRSWALHRKAETSPSWERVKSLCHRMSSMYMPSR